MKLAEALAERGDCQKRIEDLKARLLRCAKVQEGEKPAEDPADLLAELDRIFGRLLELVTSINRANAATSFEGPKTVSDAIAERDVLGKKRDLLEAVADAASARQDRYSKSEVKFIATVPVGELQKQKDRLSKEYRELDTKLQELNWKTDII